ncbi:nicotinate-nucleotide adenylyltransferase [Pseudochelatococcus contaminans]|uniref:Probable nicotinate-nucleotide adenylyltransferase n=1 Tax=Pseudochelatococcus contaminans TaxID=1538103 RepID=A0A7W5Z4I2_9HYPH|nr:nicotinate-nucleotide adenylyltransferase [Pseudochelatococcus contaminans]MBB3809849.1 nicotinate-nucleotide adenylyltransferase [Pseudochelatococcus contaminans]
MRGALPVLPPHAPGLRIGLFGGSFNPAHDGHRLASLAALKRLQLDRVWWIVTPGNPLKDNSSLPPLAERMKAAAAVARHPRIDITGFEADIDTHFTYDTIAYLKRRCPQVDFVWIMGADNLKGFHRWQRWRDIARLVPIAIIDRPGSTLQAVNARAAVTLARYRIPEEDAGLLASAPLPAWTFLYGPRSPLSSTQIREAAARNGA